MVKRSLLGGGLVLAVGVSTAVACSNYVPPDVGTYGPPNGLSGKQPYPPENLTEAGTTPPPASGDGGTTGGGFLCQADGGTIVDASGCTVTFSGDIYPKMQATGAWGCAGTTNGCHGSTAASSPILTGITTQAAFYAAFANFTLPGDPRPYFNPCSTDPTQSSFVCNTAATGTCGSLMPTGGVTIAAADLATIGQWVACGAPDN